MRREPAAKAMRSFWDDRAKENAAFYVDTSLDYDSPDMERFFATGERVVDEALRQAPVKPEGRALAVEIGSGLGRICKALAGEFERVVGLDISPTMVAQAAALVADDRVTFEVVDGRTLAPIADASADFVCTFTVFQHQRSRGLIADYLTECGRVVRPGGVVALQWNNLPPVRYRLETLRWRLRLRRRRDRAATQTAPEFRGTTAPTAWMRSQLDRAGFDVAGTAGEGTLFAWAWGRRR